LEAFRNLGLGASWENPDTLLLTLSDEAAHFDTGSSVLKPEALARLKGLAERLHYFPGCSLSVDGHTDKAGHLAFNQALSLHRAEAVRDALISMGVPGESFSSVKGWDFQKPLSNEDSVEGAAQNRRVEVRVHLKR
jgi:outer membrane protein OmpA-like peptidoglycan-associated protein